jgi:hypothetical protein
MTVSQRAGFSMGGKEEASIKKGEHTVSKSSGMRGCSMYPQNVSIITNIYMV